MLCLILNKSGVNALSNINAKWLFKNSRWGITTSSTELKLGNHCLTETGKILGVIKKYELRNLPPKFVPIKDLVEKFISAKSATFKSKSKGSSLVKVYIDKEQFITRTKGKLKIKNGSFRTNIPWLRAALKNAGLDDVTPDTGWEPIK